ncbi:MAG TPA: pentapeptide repeat-containing protein [Candidatus Saccharimonadales bacterium]|nr:pentapeptide repeat-containing protein [Candidatus Saccharimonadales bacterium]
MNKPAVSNISDDLTPLQAPALKHELALEDARAAALDWSNQSAGNVSLNGVVIDKGDFTGSKLPKASWIDCCLLDCQLAGAAIDDAGLHRIEFIQSRASGLTSTNSHLQDVHFRGCRLNLANFRFSHFKNVVFEDCDLAEADFAYAQLEHVQFRACTLTGSEFSGARLQQVDLRSSTVDGLKGVSSLKGATVDDTQLLTLSYPLAAEIGIRVQS